MASHSGSGLTLKCAIKESDGRSKTRESEQWILSKIQVRSYITGWLCVHQCFPLTPLTPENLKTLKSTFHIQSHFFCWLNRSSMLTSFTWVEARLHLNNESCATDIWKGAGWKRWALPCPSARQCAVAGGPWCRFCRMRGGCILSSQTQANRQTS